MGNKLINHPAAWHPSDFSSEDDYSFDLETHHIEALKSRVDAVKKSGIGLHEIMPNHFALPEIANALGKIRQELLHGRGLFFIRGFPVDSCELDDISLMYFGIGSYFGRGVSQSPMGDRLGYVTDASKPGEMERGYRSAQELSMHTDSDDIISLLCIRQARFGGLSKLVSGYSIYNEMIKTRPDLIEPLVEGFHYHWFGEEPPGDPPITSYKIPVFSWSENILSICYLREYIDMAAEQMNQPLTNQQVEALNLFEKISQREDFVLQFMHQPGNAIFVNNYTMLHSRTSFVDWAEPDQKRLLLRLWLKAEQDRPIHSKLRKYYGVDGMHVDGRTKTSFDGAQNFIDDRLC